MTRSFVEAYILLLHVIFTGMKHEDMSWLSALKKRSDLEASGLTYSAKMMLGHNFLVLPGLHLLEYIKLKKQKLNGSGERELKAKRLKQLLHMSRRHERRKIGSLLERLLVSS